MPRAFAITPATPTIRLNASGQGEISFTVSNALGRAARIRITLVPEGQTKREWLALSGDAERDLAADGTQQVSVKIAAPAGTAPGSYGFHPLVSTVTNPDEEYAEGATVSFDVAPSAAPKQPFPWWIVAAGAGALVIIIVAITVFSKLSHLHLHDTCNPAKSKCASSLACVPTGSKSECLTVAGKKCEARADCASDICTDGRCVEPPPGANCAADTDCPRSQKCVDVRPGVKSCLLRQEQPCTGDLQCVSAWCTDKKVCSRDDGRCAPETATQDCRPNVLECKNNLCVLLAGQVCSKDEQCTTGFCDGTCKPSPPCIPACPEFYTCVRGTCRPFMIMHPLNTQILRQATPLQK